MILVWLLAIAFLFFLAAGVACALAVGMAYVSARLVVKGPGLLD